MPGLPAAHAKRADAGGRKTGTFRLLAIGVGIAAGLLNGLLSVGGTFLVPAFVHVLGERQHVAHATSLAVILAMSIVSVVIYQLRHGIDLTLALALAAGAVPGAWAGARLMPRISEFWLRRVFAVAMTAAALRMVWGG